MPWWVYGTIKDGKKMGSGVVVGPIGDENSASDKCLKLLHPHKVNLSTSDRTRAVQEIRAKMTENGTSFSDALSRHGSKIPENRSHNINVDEEVQF